MRLITATLLLLLAACGQSGALYFAKPESAPEPAPAATEQPQQDQDTDHDNRP